MPYRSMVLRTLIADSVVRTVVSLSENPDGKEHSYLFVAIGDHIYNGFLRWHLFNPVRNRQTN